MKLISLGYKQEGTGKLYSVALGGGGGIFPIELGKEYSQVGVTLFPQVCFSSIFEDRVSDKINSLKLERIYLEIELDISEKDYEKCVSGAMYNNIFKEKKVIFIKECTNPIEYTYNLAIRNSKNWAKHRESWEDILETLPSISEKEVEFGKKFFHRYLTVGNGKNSNIKKYGTSIEINKNTLPYIEYILENRELFKYTVHFGRYSSNNVTAEDLDKYITKEENFIEVYKQLVGNHKKDLVKSKWFNEELFIKELNKYGGFYHKRDFELLKELGYDMDNLYRNVFFKNYMREISYEIDEHAVNFTEEEKYEKDGYTLKIGIYDILNDKDYQPLVRTYDPFQYYCCRDCDGEPPVGEAYDYLEDIRIDSFYKLLDEFLPFLTEECADLFLPFVPFINYNILPKEYKYSILIKAIYEK